MDAIEITQEMQNEYLESLIYGFLCAVSWFRGDLSAAIKYAEIAQEVSRRGTKSGKFLSGNEGIARGMQGFYIMELEILQSTFRFDQASLCFRQGLQLIFETGAYYHMHMPFASLAYLELLKGGDISKARALAYADESMSVMELRSDGSLDPFYLRSFLIAYKVLLANQDSRAPGILEKAYSFLKSEVQKISVEEYRISFIECFPWNREIVQLWNCRSGWQEDRPERVV